MGQCEVMGGATDEVLIKKAKYYSAEEVEERLDTIAEVGWGSFKAEVIKMYAGDTKWKYTRATIGELVDKRSLAGIPDREALLEFQRDFKVQIDFVKDLSTAEISSLFMRGLPRIVEERLWERLRIKYVDHYASAPYSLEQMFTGLTWLYDGGLSTTSLGGAEREGERIARNVEERKPTVVKTEATEYTAVTEALKGLTNMMAMMTQNQLSASRAPERYPRQPMQVYAPASAFVQPARPMGGLTGFPAPQGWDAGFVNSPDTLYRSAPWSKYTSGSEKRCATL